MNVKLERTDCADCASRGKSVFCDLHQDQLDVLNSEKGCMIYKKGQIVFNAGAYPHGLFCVKEGKVKIFRIGDEGKEQIVRLAREGDILGYRALLSGDKYASGAEVLEDSKICFIPQKAFLGLVDSNGALSMQLMKLLSQDLKNAEHRMIDLAQKPVRERVAEALLYLKNTYGTEEDGKTISVSLSREDIANIVGTATETAIRLLSEFKNDELIALSGKKISIINYDQLVKAANVFD
ncbi:MAG: Crp/Fnr family transcriptional regulator [Bacteroidetes bacterium]|nr:Crp/Fnr family transcriptional regulator [Bacteroidota bacterium]